MKGDAGRERRFFGLYTRHYRAVLAFVIRRCPDRSDAYDVLAETFLVAWRRLEEVPPEPETLLWLYGVARRVLANSTRASTRRRRLRDRLAGLAPETSDIEDRMWWDEERRAVMAALERLDPADQELLRLVAWERLAHREIGSLLGCSENAVAVRLHRARERLALELGRARQPSGVRPPPRHSAVGPGGEDHRR